MIARSQAFTLFVLAVSTPAALAQNKIELSPFVGVRSAGSFRGDNQLFSFAMSSSPTFGTFFNYPLAGNLQFEALWSHPELARHSQSAESRGPSQSARNRSLRHEHQLFPWRYPLGRRQ